MGLVYISLRTNDIEYLLLCSLAIRKASLEKHQHRLEDSTAHDSLRGQGSFRSQSHHDRLLCLAKASPQSPTTDAGAGASRESVATQPRPRMCHRSTRASGRHHQSTAALESPEIYSLGPQRWGNWIGSQPRKSSLRRRERGVSGARFSGAEAGVLAGDKPLPQTRVRKVC